MSSYYDAKMRYIQPEYGRQPTFSSFLPGIAGPWGIPAWCNYNNRGQAVCSFGVQDKDHAILEFTAASTAYQRTALTGFRTFIKENQTVTEPFADGTGTMIVEPNALTLTWKGSGLSVEVQYFTLPNARMAGLCRKLRVTNESKRSIHIALLDGLATMVPYGIRDEKLKQEAQLSTAWMQVENLEENLPYFRVRASLEDSAKVTAVEGGNFKLAFAEDGKPLATIVQPSLVFGWDTALIQPVGFLNYSLADILQREQLTGNFLPCCMTPWEGGLGQEESLTLWEFYGQAENIGRMREFCEKACNAAYFEGKLQEARHLAEKLTAPVKCQTAKAVFDGYVAQNFLDNVMRGGLPYRLDDRKDCLPVYLYSRKHGDPEREYNYFYLSRGYFSQGNGHFRDICQNRRSDAFVNPAAGAFNIQLFFELLQPDGYNPLVLEPVSYLAAHPDQLVRMVDPSYQKRAAEILEKPFSVGALAMEAEGWHLENRNAFLASVVADSQMEPNATLQEGYWSDHWTYLLDLLESEAAIFPEREEQLLFGEPKFRWFARQAVVRPQAARYCMTEAGLRQYNCTAREETESKWTLTQNGAVATSNLAEKLLLLCAIKYATLDLSGAAVEMEGGKPGWYDALNGLPGLLGASIAEGCELLRMLDYLIDREAMFPEKCEVYEEIWDLLDEIYRLDKDDVSNYEKWIRRNELRDQYRSRTKTGFSGIRVSVCAQKLAAMLGSLADSLRKTIAAETAENGGICPTYFYYEATETVKTETGFLPTKLHKVTLPLFLEGPTRWLRTKQDAGEKRQMVNAVRSSALLDQKLRMYKLNASLADVSYEVGRARAFPPGWLENESIWLHMEYKYLLALLECGMYEQFFRDFTATAIPFLPAEMYKRSTLENSSFLVSSVNTDTESHGRGYVSRLSGSTAEFISIWNQMLFGKKPFGWDSRGLYLQFTPAIPQELLHPGCSLKGTFLGGTEVKYHPGELTELRPGAYRISGYRLWKDGTSVQITGSIVPQAWALPIRDGAVSHMDVYFEKG